MARVLALSSQVARGHVGLSAIVPALQGLGHDVTALPTILLSHHRGYNVSASRPIDVRFLDDMLTALDRVPGLHEIDAVHTGYLPSLDHVAFAVRLIDRVRERNPNALALCDPILGDDPKGLYLNEQAARLIRDVLLTRANITTPNRFELAWLSGLAVTNEITSIAAARALHVPTVVATSIPPADRPETKVATVLIETSQACSVVGDRIAAAPQGTGDFMAALFFGHMLNGHDAPSALALAQSGVTAALAKTAGQDELCLFTGREMWIAPEHIAVTRRLVK